MAGSHHADSAYLFMKISDNASTMVFWTSETSV